MTTFNSYPTTKNLADFNTLFGPFESTYKFEGTKYRITKDLYGSDLLKVIKSELKDYLTSLKKEKGIKIKLSGRKSRGGYTTSFTFEITESTLNVTSSEFFKIKADLENIIKAYNYDDSDSMTDYFNVRFYGGHINVAYKLQMRDNND